MPFTSTQISGLVGGQQVMFANQATFANQIGGMGGGQQQPMMANPYPSPSYGVAGLDPGSPDIGAKLAGGIAMSLPGMAAGGSMAASMMGYKNPLGLLDPFTGISRAFGAGTGGGMMARAGVMAGAEGMGLGYGWGNISGAFARGGMRAGLGAVGGGLAGAAAAAVPYYVAGKALEYGAENLYQGVQNFQDVRRMSAQYMEPQYGQPGARMGGRMGAGQIKQMTSFMHEMASEDVQTTMKDMRQLMERSGQMGMLQGIGDVSQFKQRFRDIVRQTRGIAQILGTTLAEALPVANQLQQMGMWTARDVMGTAGAIKAAGPGGAQAVMGAMQQGAQMSYQMGGRLESGARLGQELMGQVGAATRVGTFSQQDIRNMTGGVGGAEGQRMVAGNIQQVFAGFGQSAMGRLMMAGLGEVKQGEFTGQMNEKLLAQFNRGEIGIAELQQRGQQRIQSSKALAVSFFNRADELGQEMAQKGGMTGMAQGIQQAMAKAGYAGAEAPIQNRFIQLITGSNQRQADMIQKIIQDLPRIQAEEERATNAALEDSFNQLNERRNNSLKGLGDAVSKAMHEGVGRPLQELAETFTTTASEATASFADRLYGRTRALPKLGVEQRLMMAQSVSAGNRPAPMQVQGIGQSFMQGGGMENLITRVGEEGFGGRFLGGIGQGAAAGAGAGLLAGPLGVGAGAVLGGVAGGAGAALGMGEVETPRMRALKAAGLREGGGPEEAERVARRAYVRQVDPSMGGMFGGETEQKRAAMETVKAKMREVYNDRTKADRLAGLAKSDPSAQRDEIMRLLKSDPKTKAAAELLEKATGGEIGSAVAGLDVIAGAQAELDYKGKHALDLRKLTSGLPIPPTDPEEIKKYRQENIEKMSESLGGFSWKGLARATGMGAAAYGVTTAGLGTGIGAVLGAVGYMATRKMSTAETEAAMGSKLFSPQDIKDYFAGKGGGRFAEALSNGDAAAQKIKDQYDRGSEEDKAKFIQTLDTESGVKYEQYTKERRERMKASAESQGPMVSIAGVRGDVTRQLESARKSFAAGDVGAGEAAIERIAKSGLQQGEIGALLGGAGGLAGQQAGRLAKIKGLGEMSRAEVTKLLKGGLGGVNFEGAGIGEEVEKMLARGPGDKISGSEVGQLKKLLEAAAPGALGQGLGAKTPAQDAQEKYITAMSNFTAAVNKIALVDKKDVKGDNPVLAKVAESG